MSLTEIFLSMGTILFIAAGIIGWNDRKDDAQSRNTAQSVYFDKIERTLIKIDENQVKDGEAIEAVVAGVDHFSNRLVDVENKQRLIYSDQDKQNDKINRVRDEVIQIRERLAKMTRKKATEFPKPTAVDLVNRKPSGKPSLGKGVGAILEDRK